MSTDYDEYKEYLEAKYGKTSNLPRRMITKKELIDLLVASGTSDKDAEIRAAIIEDVGTEILIGGEWLSVGAKSNGN